MPSDSAARSDTEVRRRPEQGRSRAGVQAILDAAAALLNNKGMDQITITEIAKHAGLSKAALYRYFPTKTAVIRELALREFVEQQAIIAEQLRTDVELKESLLDGLRVYLLSHRTQPFRAQLRAIIRADPELSRLDIADSRSNAATVCSFLVERGMLDEGDLAERLLLVIEMTDSVIRLVSIVEEAEGDQLVEQFCEMAGQHIFG